MILSIVFYFILFWTNVLVAHNSLMAQCILVSCCSPDVARCTQTRNEPKMDLIAGINFTTCH